MVTTKKQDENDLNVPPSERGKGENMTLGERSPDAVFGLVGLTYLVLLLVVVLGIVLWVFVLR